MDARYAEFPEGFFARADEAPDDRFYAPPRLVEHLDASAIAAVGDLYAALGLRGAVLDLCASWVSHFHAAPARLVVVGMNAEELARNPQAAERVVHDLNADPRLPFPDAAFDAATCCVSVDYLAQPLEVFDEVARVLRPGAPFVCTFSNRCFPTKAVRGWLASSDDAHVALVARYFELSRGWVDTTADRRTPTDDPGDPLYGVWSYREGGEGRARVGGEAAGPAPPA
ncbi:MAG TPA: methyltransferase domain-containing protein [Acidimicrobiia bacterium]